MKKYKWIVLSILLVLLTGAAWARAAPTTVINWHVIANGGSSLEQGTLSLDNTLGQPLAGNDSNANLCTGFWCRDSTKHRIFIPFVLKEF